MLISFPFNAVACTEATTNHDSSSPLCTDEEHDITAYMTACSYLLAKTLLAFRSLRVYGQQFFHCHFYLSISL